MAHEEHLDHRRPQYRRRRLEGLQDFVVDLAEGLVDRWRRTAADRQAEAWDEGRRAQTEYQKQSEAGPGGEGVPEPVNPYRNKDDDRG